MSSVQLTNTCSISGKVFRASLPHAVASTFRARKPATVSSSRANSTVNRSRAAWATAGSWLKNKLPAANSWVSLKPLSLAMALRKLVGRFSSRPQPSPVLPSAAMAPRWVSRFSELMAVWMTQ